MMDKDQEEFKWTGEGLRQNYKTEFPEAPHKQFLHLFSNAGLL